MMISLDKDIEDCLYALKLCFTRVATRSSIQEKGACWFLVQPLCKPSLEGSGDKGMTSLSDLYVFYCRRSSCQPNSKFLEQLMVDEKETRVFDFSKNFLGSKGFDPALETARNNMKLERLDFSDNWLTKDSVLKIVKVAIRHPTLTSINLSNNPLHLSCCKALLHLLQRNANITELQLEGTEIVPAMKERIAREVEANRTRTADEKAKLLQFEAEHRMRKALAPELLPGNVAVGEWKGETAGGCLTYTTWRENPQFLLYPAEDGLCTLELRQRDRLVDCDGESKNLQKVVMGLLVVQGTGVQRILSIKKGSIVGESEYSDDEKVRLQVRLESRQKGRDLPYIVIATTVHPGREARFTLSCHSQVDDIHDETRFLLDAVDDAYDWFRTPRIQSSWTESTSGGDRKNTSWRANPQFCITFNERTRRAVRMVILLAKSLDEESNDERTIGFYVVRGMLNRQRRIVLKPFHLIGESQFVRKASVSLELEVDPCVEGYYIIPATKDRGHIGPFTLTVYATSEVNVKPIDSSRDWPEYVIHNAWTETTNGGYRSRNQGSWLHNPSFPLHVASPTDVLICLERAGRATSVRIATSAFKSAADKGQIGVGLLLTSNDDEFKTLRESEFVYEGEATIFLENLPPKKDGYLIVPCTFDAGDHSNYILRLYSSKPLGEGSLEPMRRMEERAREKEAEQHARVNVKKRKEPSSPKSLKGARPTSESQDSLQQQEETAAAQQREAIIEACLRSGQKYVDREFPPGPSSLYFEADCPPEPAPPVRTWKRASEVRDNPQLFLHRHTIVRTGHWNDASLLGAFGLLGVRPEQLQNLFVAAYPEHGFYQVRYFQFGVWKTLTIDDYLPVDSNDGLVFAQSEDPNEIWVSLLEKAYAKLHGSYQSLQHGSEQEALMDITGGLVDPLRMSEPGDPPVPLNKRESTYAHVWDTLVQYDANQWFVGCGAFDKGQVTEGNYGVGILYNKLYAVVDCRAVQGHKLVRLRNPWGLLEWAGRWSDTSEHWTDELQRVLDYRREPDGTFWMSFADFCYFFNRLYLCRLPSDRDSYLFRWYGAWDGTGGGTENHKTFIANQQFALNLAQPSAEPVNLYIVLSQPDAPDGVYTGIGFYIIETDDNTQRLLRLTDREVIHGSGFERTRQIAMVVSLSSARKYVFVPTTQDLRKRGDYMVTMSADKKVACDLITRDADVVVEGKWKGLTAGGGPGVFGTWRRNTQWLLYPSVDATVTLTLRQHALPHGPSAPLPMGLLVLDGKQIKRTLEYAPADVMATTGHDASAEVVLQVALNSVQTRAGRPYVLIPSLYSPTQEAGYTLTARCNKRLQLQQVDPDFDWVHTQVKGGWHEKASTAGGCLDYSSWRENVQYHLQFTDESCQIFMMLSKVLPPGSTPDSNTTEIGFVVAKGTSIEGGRRQKLRLTKDDIMMEVRGSSEHVIGKGMLPARECGYYVIPYTKYPDTDLAYVLDIYTSCEATAVPVQGSENWVCKRVAGEWIPGHNAGGSRQLSRTWLNNPFYSLTLQYPTSVVVMITQLPRLVGPDAFKPPPTTKAGFDLAKKEERRLRRMPATVREGNVDIGVDLCKDDAETSIIASSGYSSATEVLLTIPDLEVGAAPYILVPHSYETEHDAKFQLTVYSDLPVQLEPIEKGRQ